MSVITSQILKFVDFAKSVSLAMVRRMSRETSPYIINRLKPVRRQILSGYYFPVHGLQPEIEKLLLPFTVFNQQYTDQEKSMTSL